MKIYMDVCCLNRPFDDLSQERVYFEAEAVLAIISNCESGKWMLLSSGTIEFELSRIADPEKYEKVHTLYSSATEYINIMPDVVERARQFQKSGIKYFDSLHLALAEKAEADILLTTDDQFFIAAQRTDAKVKVTNPAKWFIEVMGNEQ